MSRAFAICLVVSLASFGSQKACAQASENPGKDTTGYYYPSQDSVSALDSAYHARKAELEEWVHSEEVHGRPQSDFLSVYAGYGGYLRILPRDLNQFFSERVLRPDPLSDRTQFATVDRAIVLSGQMLLGENWGIYLEYDFLAKWVNTIVDSSIPGPQNLSGAEEELDLTEHSLIVGGTYVIINGPWYRLRASGGMGGVFALTNETESGGYARAASATGYQVNFDLENDFRVSKAVSFTIDVLTRSVTTGELKTSAGQTLDAPFGKRTVPLTLKPTASNLVYGAAAGLVYYF